MKLCWHRWERINEYDEYRCAKCGRQEFVPARMLVPVLGRALWRKVRYDPFGLGRGRQSS